MLLTVKSSAQIAKDLEQIKNPESEVNELNKEDVGNLLDGLTGDEATKEILKDLAKEESLENMGVDKPTAGAIGTLVDSVANYDTTASDAVQPPSSDADVEKATSAVESLLGASTNAKNDSATFVFSDNKDEAQTKMKAFVDNLTSSPFIYAVTIQKGEELGFKTQSGTNLSNSEVEWLNEVLAAPENGYSATTQQDVKEMFGI